MIWLAAGLVLFLGSHSLEIFAAPQKQALAAKIGTGPWRGLVSLAAVVGFALIVVGYPQAAAGSGAALWAPSPLLHGVTLSFTLAAFILIIAAYVPGNHFKRALGDPMVIGTALWAVGHLLMRPTAAGGLLFGAFALWALVDLWSVRRRRAASGGVEAAPARPAATLIAVVAGIAVWTLFALYLHRILIGVSPL